MYPRNQILHGISGNYSKYVISEIRLTDPALGLYRRFIQNQNERFLVGLFCYKLPSWRDYAKIRVKILFFWTRLPLYPHIGRNSRRGHYVVYEYIIWEELACRTALVRTITLCNKKKNFGLSEFFCAKVLLWPKTNSHVVGRAEKM